MVSSTETDCPAFFFSLDDGSGSDPEASIFTFDRQNSKLTTFSTDLSQAGIHTLQLLVRYEGDPAHYTSHGTLEFTVRLSNRVEDRSRASTG